MSQQYEKFFKRLQKVSGQHPQWSACCPAHKDEKASLSVAIGTDGRLLFQCHAPSKCEPQKILEAMQLEWRDCFPSRGSFMTDNTPTQPQQQAPQRKYVKGYDYRDENGIILYQVCRWEPKHFTQRRANPDFNNKMPVDKEKNPQWFNNMDGVKRVLYKLPELLRDIKANAERFVFIVEGEKDVDLMRDNQIVATTMPGGALKWLPEYNQWLKNCNVCIIPDNDPVDSTIGFSPGKRHAELVAQSLTGVAKNIVILELPNLPPKGDFSDWWAAQTDKPDERKKRLGVMVRDILNAKQAAAATTTGTPTQPATGTTSTTGQPSQTGTTGSTQPVETQPTGTATPTPTTTVQQPAPTPTPVATPAQQAPTPVPAATVTPVNTVVAVPTMPVAKTIENVMRIIGQQEVTACMERVKQKEQRGFPPIMNIYDAIGRLQIELDKLKNLTQFHNTTVLDQMRGQLQEIADVAIIAICDVPGLQRAE